MFFQHIYDKTLAQGSYLIGCQATKEAVVIDAKRDVDTYLDVAKQNGLNIVAVTETHIHADFLTGTRELAALTGATIYLSDEGGPDWQYEFAHKGLKDGDQIRVGNLTFEILHTPGHTPESISFLLRDHPASDEPVMIFTGDFVFVGDVGRPDLLEKAAGIAGTQDLGARQMYESIQKFSKLPQHIQVWPGHGAGSACGKALGAVPSSTIGYEMIRNWAFQFENKERDFVQELLSGQPEPPRYFAMMKRLNKVDRPLLTAVPQHPLLSTSEFLNAYDQGAIVLDARSKAQTEKGAIPGSLTIAGNNSFATWAGWFVDYDQPIILVAPGSQVEDLTRKLMRIGLDQVIGYISDVSDLGLTLETTSLIDQDQFKAYLSKPDTQILDIRNTSEYQSGHIHGVEHLFLGAIPHQLDRVQQDKQIVIHCQSGARAAIAHSVLANSGVKNMLVYPGGMNEWVADGNPVERL